MTYGQEYGERISLITDISEETINFKGWCLSDHLKGIEIEYKNVDTGTLQLIKERLKHQFNNYKLV